MSEESKELFEYIINSTEAEAAREALIDAGLDHAGGGAAITKLVNKAARQYAREYSTSVKDAESIFSTSDRTEVEFALMQWVIAEVEKSQEMERSARPAFK